ncbi:hypothetical protein HAX54_034707 [Datura stramonium]|uniref:BHLH domain-containing protein n=1 Tax=Datura stramonium TaxID=4076 RepID=A0ABS8SEI7_DATST|nr:hypothetical protein [Datura stramonium]
MFSSLEQHSCLLSAKAITTQKSFFQGMEYTGSFSYEDEFSFELKPNFCQDIHDSSTPSAAYTAIKSTQIKPTSSPLISSNGSSSSSSGGFLISFSSLPQEEDDDIAAMMSSENACQNQSGANSNNTNNNMYKRSPVQAQHHVIAERKRREKMGDLFISLSKVVPGLKKLDKSSILGDTIEYMKELQEQVKLLEESKKNIIYAASGSTSKDQVVVGSNKIKARIFEKSVLINIHCTKQDGMMGRLLCQMEQLHLSVHDIRIMPFGSTNLEIAILSEMEDGCCMNVHDIVKAIQINVLDLVNY